MKWADFLVRRIPTCTWEPVVWSSLNDIGSLVDKQFKDTVFSRPFPSPAPPHPPGSSPNTVHLGWLSGLLGLFTVPLQLGARPETPFSGRQRRGGPGLGGQPSSLGFGKSIIWQHFLVPSTWLLFISSGPISPSCSCTVSTFFLA